MITKITTFSNPTDPYKSDLCQLYYVAGLQQYASENGALFERISQYRFMKAVQFFFRVGNSHKLNKLLGKDHWFFNVVHWLADIIKKKTSLALKYRNIEPGQYYITMKDGCEYKVYIDHQDSSERYYPEMLKWCDVYFKANYSKYIKYEEKIIPMVNGNPNIPGNLSYFRSCRKMGKQYDLSCILRVWGGRDEVEGIEHNLRLIEALSKADCKKYFHIQLIESSAAYVAKRLDALRIPWSMDPIPFKTYLKISARSKLVIARHGMHFCMPWGIIDKLAIGACIVLDHDPYTVWPQPLARNKNYFSLDVESSPKQLFSPLDAYAAVPGKIHEFLVNGEARKRISENNSNYFDDYCVPYKIGEHIIRTVLGASPIHPARLAV